uniref:Uncharacterized protein n=1 Tax=Arion vulgaris TaxID=1028688 RepID=A0A0B7A9J2_9EUPU
MSPRDSIQGSFSLGLFNSKKNHKESCWESREPDDSQGMLCLVKKVGNRCVILYGATKFFVIHKYVRLSSHHEGNW